MWIGVIIVLLNGMLQPAVEVFASKADCEEAISSVAKQIKDKNHPEFTLIHAKCDEVK